VSDTDRAYTAGLFDGEGCVNAYFAGKYIAQRVSITNTDKALLEGIQKELGFGRLINRPKQEDRKDTFSLEFNKVDHISMFIEYILPYVRLKRLQCLLSLELTKTARSHGIVSDNNMKIRQTCFSLLRELNRRGDCQKLGEFSELLNSLREHVNTEPSSSKGREVDEKVQRLTGEEPINNPDTSTQPEREDIV